LKVYTTCITVFSYLKQK